MFTVIEQSWPMRKMKDKKVDGKDGECIMANLIVLGNSIE